MLSSGSASGGELTFIAAVVNLKVEPHEASESRFPIRYNFDSFSWLLKCFVECDITATRILQSKTNR